MNDRSEQDWLLNGFIISAPVMKRWTTARFVRNIHSAKVSAFILCKRRAPRLNISLLHLHCNDATDWSVVPQAAQARHERKIINVNETYANVSLALEWCCVTKMRFTRVCMGTLRVCFKYLKFNVLCIKPTFLPFLSYSLLFHGVWGHFEAFSAS